MAGALDRDIYLTILDEVVLMTALKYSDIAPQKFGEGAERRVAHTDDLMIVVVDFFDGPKSQPDAPHSHPHQQACYVAEGEILFIMDGEQARLGPGDVFLVPSGRSHTIQRLSEHVRLVDCFTPIREDFLK
jgi:quercetin dioxygenase-like cupin family protein